jgi:hypothetical protein
MCGRWGQQSHHPEISLLPLLVSHVPLAERGLGLALQELPRTQAQLPGKGLMISLGGWLGFWLWVSPGETK